MVTIPTQTVQPPAKRLPQRPSHRPIQPRFTPNHLTAMYTRQDVSNKPCTWTEINLPEGNTKFRWAEYTHGTYDIIHSAPYTTGETHIGSIAYRFDLQDWVINHITNLGQPTEFNPYDDLESAIVALHTIRQQWGEVSIDLAMAA